MILDRFFTGAAGSAAFAFLLEATLKGTALLILAALAALLLRRGSAAHRHLAWTCALAGLVALPIMLAVAPAWRVNAPALAWLTPGSSTLPADNVSPALAPASDEVDSPNAATPLPPGVPEARGTTPPGDAATSDAAATPPVVSTHAPSRGIAWPAVALTLWMIGALAVLATFVAGHLMLRTLLRGARPVRDGEWHALAQEAADRLGLTVPFALLRGADVLVPVAFGLVRPRVVLPAGCDAWPAELRRAVLVHELAHVQRHDCLTQAVAQLACALFWFHPGAWWAASRLQVEREHACDDRVLAARTRATDYADHLLDMVRSLRARRLAALGAVAFARPSSLEGRLLAVLDPRRDRRAVGPRIAVPAALLAAVLVLPFAALELVTAGAPQASGRKTIVHANGDPNALRPSRVTPVPDPARTLDQRAAWARAEAGRSGDDVWWIGWMIETSTSMKGDLLGDSEGLNLDMLSRRGAFSLEDVLAAREQGTANTRDDAEHEERSEPAAILVRMAPGGIVRVRVQSSRLPVEFSGEPLYWLDQVPESQTFAWLRAAAASQGNVRMQARLIESISYMRNSELVGPYLTATFRGNGPDKVRAIAAEGMAHHPSPDAVRMLASAARNDRSREVRRACVEALGRFKTPEALDALLAIAKVSEGSERRAAFDALGEKVSHQAPEPAAAGGGATSDHVQVDAGTSEPDQEKEVDKLGPDTGLPDVESQGMPQADFEVQRQAIESLGRYPEAQSVQLLWRIAQTSPNAELRAQAVESIGRVGTPSALSMLNEIVWKNRMGRARQAAVEMIGRRFEGDQAIEKLMPIARTHPSGETRRMAVEMLGRVDSPRAVESLERIVSEGVDVESQRQAVESLGRREGDGTDRRLNEIARTHRSVEVRRQAVESLGRRQGGTTAEQLMAIANADVPREVQRQAVESLGRLEDPRARGMLMELARRHPSIEVERQAVESLGRLEGDVMGDLAQIARSHPSGEVRRQAVESMTRRDPDQALPLLEEIVKPAKPKSGS